MKKGTIGLITALIFLTELAFGADGKSSPANYTPIDSLQKYYKPLIKKKNDLAEAGRSFSREKIDGLFKELQTEMRLELNEDVYNYINHYTTGQKYNFEIALSLRNYYAIHISETLSQNQLPTEISILPLVLSGVHNQAISPEGGVGIWRLNYYVAKKYGLTINEFVDERKDPIKSTKVAARYLQDLFKKYKSWNMAITAFSYSPALVNKAIMRSGNKSNYWAVRPFLREDAQNLISSFFAAVYVSNFYLEHNLNPPGILVNQQKEELNIKEPVRIELLAEKLNLNVTSLRMMNPTHRGSLIHSSEKSGIAFFVPTGVNQKVIAFADDLYKETKKKEQPVKVVRKYSSPQPVVPENKDRIVYTVKSGDYLGKIAEKYHVGVSSVRRWNALRSDRIDIGQKLYIYVAKGSSVKKTSSPKKKETKPATAAKKVDASRLMTYTVKSGDTLWGIMKSHPGNSIESIKQINGIGESLKPGQVIKLIKP